MNCHDGLFLVGKLGWQLIGLLSWIPRGENLEAEVARFTLGFSVTALRNLAEGPVGEDLTAACSWHLGDGGKVARDDGKLECSGRRQVARHFLGDVAALLQLRPAEASKFSEFPSAVKPAGSPQPTAA